MLYTEYHYLHWRELEGRVPIGQYVSKKVAREGEKERAGERRREIETKVRIQKEDEEHGEK